MPIKITETVIRAIQAEWGLSNVALRVTLIQVEHRSIEVYEKSNQKTPAPCRHAIGSQDLGFLPHYPRGGE